MDFLQALLLGILQGITEFLPISSSAHLIILPQILGWSDQGLAFDVAVHVGTLTAVVFYFRKDLSLMIQDWARSLNGHPGTAQSRLFWAVLFGTIPVGFLGLLIPETVENRLRSPLVIAFATIGFGILLLWSDRQGKRSRDEHTLTWKDVLAIGTAQSLALIPGTSRSGITITAGLAMGLTRKAAARFSFLLSIPVILLAGSYKTVELLANHGTTDWFTLLVGIAASALSAYACIDFFLRLVDRIGLAPFVIYRLLLGVVLLVIF